jgi:5-aminolevulinate synthase
LNIEDIFHQKMSALRSAGEYRFFLDIERSAKTFPEFTYQDAEKKIRRAINFCSNDYLGQSVHPAVIDAAKVALEQAGTGSGGTRNISGTTTWHRQLEQQIAVLSGKAAALVFNSSYLANQSTLTTLGRHLEDCIFISDAENHASMIEGIRGSKCEKHVFRHNDVEHLEQILRFLPPSSPKIIAFESVYSMSGTMAPIREITELARHFNALTYCDEVHAVGLYGPAGAGMIAAEDAQAQIDIINGTFAKAYGVIGGFLAGSQVLMDFIRSHAEGFIFTTSLPPSNCAAILKSMEVLHQNRDIVSIFHENVRFLRQQLDELGIAYSGHASHITRIQIGDSRHCKAITDRLLSEFGLYLQPINYPTVPRGQESIRIIVSAIHSRAQIMHLAESLQIALS